MKVLHLGVLEWITGGLWGLGFSIGSFQNGSQEAAEAKFCHDASQLFGVKVFLGFFFSFSECISRGLEVNVFTREVLGWISRGLWGQDLQSGDFGDGPHQAFGNKVFELFCLLVCFFVCAIVFFPQRM